MSSVAVRFAGLPRNPSLEAAVHRWVMRLEVMRFPVRVGDVVIESARRRTAVTLQLVVERGTLVDAATVHDDPYVAIADAFRAARQRLLARAAALATG